MTTRPRRVLRTQSGDALMKRNSRPERIALHLLGFKLEAEGFEPEVLKGAQESIKLVQYVAIDCGPERYGKDTIVDCFNMLFSHGFSLLFSNFERGTFLFINGATVS